MITTQTVVMNSKRGEAPAICHGPFGLPELSELFPMESSYLQYLDKRTQDVFTRPIDKSRLTRWRDDIPDTTYYGVYLGERCETSKIAGLVTTSTVSISDMADCGCSKYLEGYDNLQEVGVIISQGRARNGSWAV